MQTLMVCWILGEHPFRLPFPTHPNMHYCRRVRNDFVINYGMKFTENGNHRDLLSVENALVLDS